MVGSSGLSSFKRKKDDQEFRVGDCVLLTPEHGGNDYIGEIKWIGGRRPGGEHAVRIAWFYRPEEVLGGRKIFHGEREVYRSDHFDDVESGTIKRKCRILDLKDYQELPKPVKPDVFYTRCFYAAAEKRFKPDKMPTYCICNLPYNPDLDMLQCLRCKDWFHVRCLQQEGVKVSNNPPQEEFYCQACQKTWNKEVE